MPAAVHADRLARDEVGLDERQHGLGNFHFASPASHRRRGRDFVDLGLRQVRRREDGPRRDGIHEDLVARKLDLLALGERNARHLGVNVEALRIGVIVLVALLVGASVAFAGIIAFVGLVIPHLMRMILGPAHLPLVTASALGGALLLTLADLGARTFVPMADLPIGMLTSLVGGPFFFWLLRRTRKRAGGWG